MKMTNATLVQRKSAAPSKSRAVNTRERIVQRSILLFNRKGLRNVAIEHIAQHLKISPGNLTYHFPRKNDLIGATLVVLEDRLKIALEQPTSVRTARDGAEYLIRLYCTFWEFRFFFNALTYVLAVPELRNDYLEFREWAIDVLEGDLAVLCEADLFVPMSPPNSYRLLAENMWSLWLNWLRTQQVLNPNAARPDDAALFDCALHNWSLCQPVMSPRYAAALLGEFRNILPDREERVKRKVPSAPAK